MLRQELESVQQTQPGKIDKHLVKNVVLSYFSAPADQKAEAQRLLALILDLDLTSRPTFWQRQATTSDSSSLSAQFVRFLEAESATTPTATALSSSSQPVRQLAQSLLTRSHSDRRPDPDQSAGPSERQ
jgi:hypothetical protein